MQSVSKQLGERELAAYREQLRAMRSDEVDLLSVEEGIMMRLKAIGAEMMAEAMKRADTQATEVVTMESAAEARERVALHEV